MSQNINIPDELKAIAEAKATFVHIGPSKPSEPEAKKVVEPEPKKTKTSKLKDTPTLPMDFTQKRNAIKRAEQLENNLNRFEGTKKLLESFKLESEENLNKQPVLVIKDSGYSGIEFKTSNIAVIKEVINCITDDIEAKIEFVKSQIAEFELPKI
ncbi:hypothetical protein GVN20_05675 [Runella sp. CRIBMP]|uniref:hypothetical protein n=1 Tax=Runella sp. CRIBMP TaxID=2683261 RepID=UPI0014134100|nr:hypothetical protein [Runella sp. CRIBMP]NBB18839.1 hypothetical protein [Runella sp. CRIBMP]